MGLGVGVYILLGLFVVGAFVTLFIFDMESSIFVMFLTMPFFLLMLILSSFGFATEYEPIKDEVMEITALKDNVANEGQFFLGSGNVEGVAYYFYMEQKELGYQMNKVAVDQSYIKEVQTGTPKIEVYKKKRTSKFAAFMFGEFLYEKEYVFHVPKGTVTTDFKVDME